MALGTKRHGRTCAAPPSSTHSVLAVEEVRCHCLLNQLCSPSPTVLLSGHQQLLQPGQVHTKEQLVPLL